jgi:hypothetical protein
MQRRHDRLMLQHEHRLDQAGHARRRFEMTEIALDAAEANAGLGPRQGESQRTDLDRVAERRSGTMPLDHAHRIGADAGDRDGLGDDRRLLILARRGEADLATAVIIDGRAENHGTNTVAAGIGHAAENDDAATAAEDGSRRPRRKAAAMPVRGHHAAGLVAIADPMWHPQADASGDGDIAFAREQRLASQMHGDQRA